MNQVEGPARCRGRSGKTSEHHSSSSESSLNRMLELLHFLKLFCTAYEHAAGMDSRRLDSPAMKPAENPAKPQPARSRIPNGIATDGYRSSWILSTG